MLNPKVLPQKMQQIPNVMLIHQHICLFFWIEESSYKLVQPYRNVEYQVKIIGLQDYYRYHDLRGSKNLQNYKYFQPFGSLEQDKDLDVSPRPVIYYQFLKRFKNGIEILASYKDVIEKIIWIE